MEFAQSPGPDPLDDKLDFARSLVPHSFDEIKVALFRNWPFVVKAVLIGTLATIGLSLLIPNEYTANVQLMPPDPQTFNSSSALSALRGSNIGVSLGTGGFMSQRTPGETAIAVLSSNRVLDDIINRYDLKKVYKQHLYYDARKTLLKYSKFTEDKKSGIISISVTDRNRNRAQEIAQSYVQELNTLVNSLSTSSARRERIFLEDRLKSIKGDLDANARELSQFSSRNNTIDIQKQGEATVEAAGKLQGELISAQSDLSALSSVYAGSNVRVQATKARINELQKQLRRIAGNPHEADGTRPQSGEIMPSIRELPLLGVTYYDLYRQVTTQEDLYQTLSKQYELAKVREAEEIPPIVVLDPADLPERKSYPHRSLIVLAGAALSFLVSCLWIVLRKPTFATVLPDSNS